MRCLLPEPPSEARQDSGSFPQGSGRSFLQRSCDCRQFRATARKGDGWSRQEPQQRPPPCVPGVRRAARKQQAPAPVPADGVCEQERPTDSTKSY